MHRSERARRDAIAAQYASVFDIPEMAHPVGYHEKNWCEERYSGGCYVGIAGPKVLTDFFEPLRTPVGRIHFAGTETATAWAGYMDGAVQSGERAAREVAESLGMDVDRLPPVEEPMNETVPAKPIGPSDMERMVPSLTTVLTCVAVALVAAVVVVAPRYWS